jgi:hypothetical protein
VPDSRAGEEKAPERPVLTVAQVFELAEVIGRHPGGNVRKLPKGGYRLRYSRNGERQTSPETYVSRADAQRALRWPSCPARSLHLTLECAERGLPAIEPVIELLHAVQLGVLTLGQDSGVTDGAAR